MKLRQIVAVLLAFIMAFSAVSVAFAKTDAEPNCPYIYIHGFMAKDLLADKDDPNSEVLWPPQTDDILDLVKACVPALAQLAIDKDYDALNEAIINPVKNALCKGNLDSNGNAVGNSGVYFVYPEADTITKTSKLKFNYDWRLDPIETAGKLNDYINYVCECSGSNKVMLECHSFGGIITETYTALYGWDKIEGICYNTTAIYGEAYTGELLSGMIEIDADALTNYLENLLGKNDYNELINGIFDILNDAGITDDISALGNTLIENIGTEAIKECLAPMFGGWLSIWAMIEDERVESSKNYIFNEIYKDGGEEHKGLVEKIDNYNTKIRPYRTKVLQAQNEDINLYVITRYNFTSVPLTPSWRVMSDSVVDTNNSSFGAQCAPSSARFSDAYLALHAGDEYVNPDGTINASSCLFPEQTWFIKDMQHAVCPDCLDDLAYDLLCYDGQATVDTFEQYPRFLQYNYADESLTADKGTVKEETFLGKLWNYILTIIAFNRSLFEKIFR